MYVVHAISNVFSLAFSSKCGVNIIITGCGFFSCNFELHFPGHRKKNYLAAFSDGQNFCFNVLTF